MMAVGLGSNRTFAATCMNGSDGPEAAVVRPSANGRKVPQCWRSIFAKWKSAIGAIEDVTLAVTAISKVNAPVCRLA
jgi:hypothetical protein